MHGVLAAVNAFKYSTDEIFRPNVHGLQALGLVLTMFQEDESIKNSSRFHIIQIMQTPTLLKKH